MFMGVYVKTYSDELSHHGVLGMKCDESTAKEFVERIMKANKKMLNGM